MNKKIKTMCLCEGRHDIPQAIDGAIFGNTIDPLNILEMKQTVHNALYGVESLRLYVTGLTVALVEVINYCKIHNIDLMLYHYNREIDSYYPQAVY